MAVDVQLYYYYYSDRYYPFMKEHNSKDNFHKDTRRKLAEEEKKALEEWYDNMEAEEGYLHTLSKEEKQGLESKMLANIRNQISSDKPEKTGFPSPSPSYSKGKQRFLASTVSKVAAVLTLGIFIWYAAAHIVHSSDEMIAYSTKNGEVLSLTLPDSSTVTLNGNTTIKYLAAWGPKATREIFLEGEAFFSVKKTQSQQKFVVHTSGDISVDVLGTEFLVSDRKDRSQVVLNSGKVQLLAPEIPGGKPIEMMPGEMILIHNSKPSQYLRTQVNPDIYTSWINHQLMLDNTSLSELCVLLQENYGYTVSSADQTLLRQRVSGSIPMKGIDTLLKDISVAYDVNIIKDQNIITISKKNEK